jgi:formate dehydrogenase
VQIISRWGKIEVLLEVTDDVMPGSVGLNQHWGHKGGWRIAGSANGRPDGRDALQSACLIL